MSLRTGQQIATTTAVIINPDTFKIEGLYCVDRYDKAELILLYQDIRDVLSQGVVVNDHDVLAEAEDLVRLKRVLSIGFQLTGKQVVTVSGKRLGKVNDYATEVETMFIQKIYVSRNIFKDLTGGSLVIDRSQINEVTDRKIIVNDPLEKGAVSAPAAA